MAPTFADVARSLVRLALAPERLGAKSSIALFFAVVAVVAEFVEFVAALEIDRHRLVARVARSRRPPHRARCVDDITPVFTVAVIARSSITLARRRLTVRLIHR